MFVFKVFFVSSSSVVSSRWSSSSRWSHRAAELDFYFLVFLREREEKKEFVEFQHETLNIKKMETKGRRPSKVPKANERQYGEGGFKRRIKRDSENCLSHSLSRFIFFSSSERKSERKSSRESYILARFGKFSALHASFGKFHRIRITTFERRREARGLGRD